MARAKSLFHSARHAINTLARLAAKNAVKEKLRGDGVRLTLVPPREIAEKAQQYLAEHPELFERALEQAKRYGLDRAANDHARPTCDIDTSATQSPAKTQSISGFPTLGNRR
jgi:hypothetical protein